MGNVSAKNGPGAYLFNIIGVIWALLLFRPFLRLIAGIVTGMGAADPFIPIAEATDSQAASTSMLYSVSLLHTLFNIINTLLLVGTTPLCKDRYLCDQGPEGRRKFRLKFIQAGLLSTANCRLTRQSRKSFILAIL